MFSTAYTLRNMTSGVVHGAIQIVSLVTIIKVTVNQNSCIILRVITTKTIRTRSLRRIGKIT